MTKYFAVEQLDIERLLQEWRWLSSASFSLVARTAFGDLFLRNDAGEIFQLDVGVGRLTKLSSSETEVRHTLENRETRRRLFAEAEVDAAATRGLVPDDSQCIAFTVPTVFAESSTQASPYIADIYECVSLLGDMHRQISDLPDGSAVRLRISPAPALKQD